MTTINLGKTVNYAVQKQVTKELTTITVLRWVDNPTKQVVMAWVKELQTPIVLWEGAAYVAIGNWTEQQAQDQLKKVLIG